MINSKVVILLVNEFEEEFLNINIIYTAITRAKDKLIIIGDKDRFNKYVCKLPKPKNSLIYKELQSYI